MRGGAALPGMVGDANQRLCHRLGVIYAKHVSVHRLDEDAILRGAHLQAPDSLVHELVQRAPVQVPRQPVVTDAVARVPFHAHTEHALTGRMLTAARIAIRASTSRAVGSTDHATHEVVPVSSSTFNDQDCHVVTCMVTALPYMPCNLLQYERCSASLKPNVETRPAIRPVREVIREHVEAVVAANPGVPQYKLAVELGWSPSTLCRMLQKWAESGETLAGDRR